MKKIIYLLAIISVLYSCRKLPSYDTNPNNPEVIDWSENSLPKITGTYILDSTYHPTYGWEKDVNLWTRYYRFGKDSVFVTSNRVVDSILQGQYKWKEYKQDNGVHVHINYLTYTYTLNDSSLRLVNKVGTYWMYLKRIKDPNLCEVVLPESACPYP